MFTSFFTFATLITTFTGKHRNQQVEKRGRFDSFGPDGMKRPNKKGISEKRPAPYVPPVTRRPRRTASPRKRSSGPLDGGFQRMASRGSFILPRDSPDSVISGPGPLMPEKGIAPPLAVTIPCVHARSKRGKAAGRKKNRRGKHFFPRWSSLLYKFCGRRRTGPPFSRRRSFRAEKGNRTRKRSPDAAGFLFVFRPFRRTRPAHFGMRNCGIGIWASSYIFIYCAKSR